MFSDKDKKTMLVYTGLALLFVYPLIQAGIFYRDDLDRSITGQYGWRGLGRPVADILMKILSASGHSNLDLFPYTLIASCLFIAGSSFALSNYLKQRNVSHAVAISALLIFNPYLLQNIAYRYDSLGMSVAFFLAVISYTYRHQHLILQTAVKLIAGILCLTLYQPCANIFIGLLAIDIAVIAVKQTSTLKSSVRLTARKTLLFLAFYLFYTLIFSPKNNARAELIPLNERGLEHLAMTLNALKDLVFAYFHQPVYLYFLVPATIAFMVMFFSFYTQKQKIISFIIYSAISLLIFLVSLMGPTIFLQDAPVYPRTLVSFSVIMVIIAIPLMQFAPRLKYAAFIPVIASLAFSAQLASALTSQQDYEEFVFNMIAQDLASFKDIDSIGTVGQLDLGQRTKLLAENKPLIYDFLEPAHDFLASFQLVNKGFPQTRHGYGEEQDKRNQLMGMISKGVKPATSNKYYSLFISDSTAMVLLGNEAIGSQERVLIPAQ